MTFRFAQAAHFIFAKLAKSDVTDVGSSVNAIQDSPFFVAFDNVCFDFIHVSRVSVNTDALYESCNGCLLRDFAFLNFPQAIAKLFRVRSVITVTAEPVNIFERRSVSLSDVVKMNVVLSYLFDSFFNARMISAFLMSGEPIKQMAT